MPNNALKFNRVAKVILGDKVIENLRMAFDLERFINGFSPFLKVSIYNLSPASRELAATTKLKFELIIGYEGHESSLFTGNIATGFTVKDNADIITTIHVSDFLEVTEKIVNISIKDPNNLEDVLTLLAKNAGVEIGEMKIENKNFINSLTLSSSLTRALNQLATSNKFIWYILNRQLYFYSTKEQSSKRKFTFNKGSGLLTTPIQTDIGIDVQVLMEPAITPFDTYDVESSFDFIQQQAGTRFAQSNSRTLGTQRVLSVIHNGDTHTNKWVTNLRGERVSGQ